MRATLTQWQSRWLSRRLPPARSITLNQRRLFIFPTRSGFMFLLSLVLMLLMAINYQSNLIYALTFWLGTLFVVTIHFTHANLSGLKVSALRVDPCFAGEQAHFRLRLEAGRRARHVLRLSWQQGTKGKRVKSEQPIGVSGIDVHQGRDVDCSLAYPVTRRGWCEPDRLLIETEYPFGLLKCWSYLALNQRVMVWPRPLPSELPQDLAQEREGEGPMTMKSQGLDLMGHRLYRAGDRIGQVDWRSLARHQPLQVSVYRDRAAEPLWLDWHHLPASDPEKRLSQLCMLALAAHAQECEFGLRLPGREVAIASGQSHLEEVLDALALYPAGGYHS